MDRLSTRTDPLGRVEAYTYDPNGNLTQFTDRKGQVSAFQYDPLNRRTRATYADGSVATFTYDAAGRLTQADDTADPHRPIALTYDTLDRLTAETTALGTVSYQYDPLGRRTEMTVSGQAPVSYTYDAASRLRTITQAPLNPVDIQYDPLNRRTRLTLPNGVSTEYQYDAASRLTALIYRNALGPLGDLTYQYDPAGNRTAVGGSFARTLHPDPVPSATYDAANQQLAFGGKTMTYDPNGSLATLTEGGATTTFTWDARNRLAALAGATTGSFAYDGTGRRARKTIAGVPTTFQHDGAEIVQAVVDGVPTPFLSGPQIDEPWARGDTEYYLADALGSIVALTEATGRPTTSYVYSAFGQTTSSGPASPNPFQYTGRENDGTSLYYYRARYYNPILLRFISEDALDLGEMILFKQADPSDATVRLLYSAVRSDPQLLHPTLYAVNSPVNYTDPSGEIVPQLVGCVVGAGISVALDVGAGRKINWFDAGVGCALGLVGGWLPGKSLHFGLHGPHHYFPRLGRSLPHLQFDWGIKGVRAKPKGFRIPLPERLGPARDRDIRFSIPGL
jgi:RHS repeat-associated protein